MTLEARIEALLARAADLNQDEIRELEALVNLQDSGIATNDEWTVDHEFAFRDKMSGKEINDLPDSAFAYIEPGGDKDDDGKTVPRSLRHYPVHDEAHARNAYARAQAQIKNNGSGKNIAQKAMPKIKAALNKFGVKIEDKMAREGFAVQNPWDESTHPTMMKSVGNAALSCPSCGSDSPPGDQFDCPQCGQNRNRDPQGGNLQDGSETGGSMTQIPTGVPDGTGSVSSRQPVEGRVMDTDDLARAFSTYVLAQYHERFGVDVQPSDGDTLPHPDTNDEQVEETETDDPIVDEGDKVKDGKSYPNEQEGEAERKSEKRSRYKPRRSSTLSTKPEHRSRVSSLEVRAATTTSGPQLNGKAIIYNTPYTVYDAFGAFTERMSPSVCDYVLASGNLDCRFLINHEGLPLARTLSGTLQLNSTKDALEVLAYLSSNSTLAADLVDAITRRDVSSMSVGFRVADDEWDDEYMNRTIHRFSDLLDVSSVTYPASPTTSIDVAKRMLFSLPVESRSAVAGAYNIVCDVGEGSKLDRECSNEVLRILEMLYNVDDAQVPLVRVREAWKIARDIRAGKTLSASNAGFIAAALESLHRADDVDVEQIRDSLGRIDDAIDDAQSALSKVSGLANPDDDDKNPAIYGRDDGCECGGECSCKTEEREEPEIDPEEARRKSELALEEAAERRRRAAKAQRERMSVRRGPHMNSESLSK